MSGVTPPCAHCTSEQTVKNDHTRNGKQNRKFKNYGEQFVVDWRNKIISPGV